MDLAAQTVDVNNLWVTGLSRRWFRAETDEDGAAADEKFFPLPARPERRERADPEATPDSPPSSNIIMSRRHSPVIRCPPTDADHPYVPGPTFGKVTLSSQRAGQP
jgi:hypothetical protein